MASLSASHLDVIERCKLVAARSAVEENITRDCVVGIGSGSTMQYVLEQLVVKCREDNLAVKCIATSRQSKQLIHDYSMQLVDLDTHPTIDVTIDGADEVDQNMVAIKGGGACQTQEKVIAHAAERFVVVADHRKNSQHLGSSWKKGVPIEVLPMACNSVRNQLVPLLNAELKDIPIRLATEKAGPLITDNGNIVLDWRFDSTKTMEYNSDDWQSVSDKIKLLPGVVETGIFANMVHRAYFGQPDSSVIKLG